MTTPIHDSFVRYFSQILANNIDSWVQTIRPDHRARIVVNSRFALDGQPTREKVPDAGLKVNRVGDANVYPRLVVEVGYSESEAELKDDAWDWLCRSSGEVQSVMLVKFRAPDPAKMQSPRNWRAWIDIWARHPEDE
jgi:hypothetical protein